jgi:predicted dehydrogenase
MGEQRASARAELGIGMLGYGFMGRAHAQAYRILAHLPTPPAALPRLVAVCGRTEARVREAAVSFGFKESTVDWRGLLADERVHIFDNSGPNDAHCESTIVAARSGRHVICEKPLGRTAEESFRMWEAAIEAEVCHMCAFNYRFVPAIRRAREMLEAGELGALHHFCGRYLQDWILDRELPMTWRFSREQSGSGALGDLGAHVIDLAHFLVGDMTSVSATCSTFIPQRPAGAVDVDDAVVAALEFKCGAIGTIEASRVCAGRRNSLTFEISGENGSIAFDLERLNELRVSSSPNGSSGGFRTILVTEADDPYLANWWPPGHVLGWDHTFVHELSHFLDAIDSRRSVAPYGATFEDGYRAAEVCDAVLRSARTGRRAAVAYRRLEEPISIGA